MLLSVTKMGNRCGGSLWLTPVDNQPQSDSGPGGAVPTLLSVSSWEPLLVSRTLRPAHIHFSRDQPQGHRAPGGNRSTGALREKWALAQRANMWVEGTGGMLSALEAKRTHLDLPGSHNQVLHQYCPPWGLQWKFLSRGKQRSKY